MHSPQCRYVCAQRRMPMHITTPPPPTPPLAVGKYVSWGSRHGSHGVCVIFVYDLPCQLESNLHICTRAKMHWNVRPESATACSHTHNEHTHTHTHTKHTHTQRKTAMRGGDKQPLTSYDERVVWGCPCRHLLYSHLPPLSFLLLPSSPLPVSLLQSSLLLLGIWTACGTRFSFSYRVPLSTLACLAMARRQVASAWFYTF